MLAMRSTVASTQIACNVKFFQVVKVKRKGRFRAMHLHAHCAVTLKFIFFNLEILPNEL